MGLGPEVTLERREIQTSLGTVVLNGRNTGRPVLFVIPGLYSSPTFGIGMQAWWPQFDVVLSRVPGDGAPELEFTSIGVFGAAYSEAISVGYSNRPIFVYGISTGALIALALRHVDLKGMFLVEPPLRTGCLWPLRDALRDIGPPGWEEISWPLFGITSVAHEARDYTAMLDSLAIATTVLVGSEPLMPRRPLDDQPSLVDIHARDILSANPMVNLVEIYNSGHGVLSAAPATVDNLLRNACKSAFGAMAAAEFDE